MSTKTILLFSGGLDSTVLLYHLLHKGNNVKALSIHYGQRHEKELLSARHIAEGLGVEHRVIDLSAVRPLLYGSSQTSDDIGVPEGHYAEESMKVTVVPNRNMMMLSVAVAWAISEKADIVAYAAHSGDHAIYPDCRKDFVRSMRTAVALCDWHTVTILTPFIEFTKDEIVAEGMLLNVPFEDTWSCYKGGDVACGRCGTCVERLEAFAVVGIADPLPYEDSAFYKFVKRNVKEVQQ
jgi:7-cyano-7-deazaguanine synthase